MQAFLKQLVILFKPLSMKTINFLSLKRKFAIALLIAISSIFNSAISQTAMFRYTGGVQTFTVPEGVTNIHVEMAGASGGKSYRKTFSYGNPGLGGKLETLLKVTPGQLLDIYVGGIGYNATTASAGRGGFNGGANGGLMKGEYAGGGGGGATDIRASNGSLKSRLLVAGGGGASGKFGAGGNGGGLQGAQAFGEGETATGGSQKGGGAGGSFYNTYFAENGRFGHGGSSSAGTTGGGGGGGWYGGGGGALGDGAGGSNYAFAGAKDVTHTQGTNEGYGYVTISWSKQEVSAKSPVTTLATTQLHIFPNPTEGEFSVQIPDGKKGKAEVWLMLSNGATVEKYTLWLTGKNDVLHLSIPGKVPGIYLVKVVTANAKFIARVLAK